MKTIHKRSNIDVKQLDFAYHVAKRLDEHRELIEDIEKNTVFFSKLEYQTYKEIAQKQDDYLVYLYYLRMGHQVIECIYPSKFTAQFPYVRPRPSCLSKAHITTPIFVRVMNIIGWRSNGKIKPKQLGNVIQHLTAHRSLINAVDTNTHFFNEQCFWHESHARYQDDYFQYLYLLQNGKAFNEKDPSKNMCPRPSVLKPSTFKQKI